MATLIAFPILGLLLILQSAVVSQIVLLQGAADLVFLAVIAWALQKRVRSAWQWGVIGGAMVTFISALPLGVALFSNLLGVGLAVVLRRRVWQAPVIAMLITTFVGTLAAHLMALVALRITGVALPLLEALNLVTLPSLLLNLILAIPMYTVMKDLSGWVYRERIEV